MLSLGGVIGTGLFLSSGYTIHQAGPFGTILSYLIGAIVVYLVMMCLGELSVHMPETGPSTATRPSISGRVPVMPSDGCTG